MINLEISDNEAKIQLYVPSPQTDLTIILSENSKVIYSKKLEAISPVKAYEDSIPLNNVLSDNHYRLTLIDKNNMEIISYQPAAKEILETPDPATAPTTPEEMADCEDLFLTGQHLEQYRHATYLPEDYYLEALKRNPNDIRNNNAYGLLMHRRGRFDIAQKHFEVAVKASTKRNPNPYDSEPFYNLGLALKKQGKLTAAYAAFYKATWSSAWQNSGFYEVATIDVIKGELNSALDHINQSIVRNNNDIKARGLKTAILRHLGKTDQAIAFANETLAIDCTSFAALYELYQLGESPSETLTDLLRNNPHNYMELSSDYGMSGLYEDALAILNLYTCRISENDVYPMIKYFEAYYYELSNKPEESAKAYKEASEADTSYCFPHRLDELIVLEAGLRSNKEDAMAHYYLGNLYYDKKQYDIAMKHWHESIELRPEFPTSSRNLALAYVNKKKDNTELGLLYLEKAFANDTEDARVFFELDQLYRKLCYTYEKRLSIMTKYMNLVSKRDDLFVEYLTLLNNVGNYEIAMEAINKRIFHPWEGGEGKVTAQYKRCRIELAKKAIQDSDYQTAIDYLSECKIYPHNLGEGKLPNAAENDIDYFIGLAYEKLDDSSNAMKHYQLASTGISEPTDAMFYNDQPADMMFYQGLAYKKKLGEGNKSLSEFNRMFDFGEKHIHDDVKIDYFAVSLPDFLVFDDDLNLKNQIHCKYLMALGLMGRGDMETAKAYLIDCYDLTNNHQGVYFHMNLPLELIA